MKGLATRGLALAQRRRPARHHGGLQQRPGHRNQGAVRAPGRDRHGDPRRHPQAADRPRVRPATRRSPRPRRRTSTTSTPTGGVYGRKINYKIMDDAYNPANDPARWSASSSWRTRSSRSSTAWARPTHTGVLDFLKTQQGARPLRGLRRRPAGTSPTKYPGTFAVQPGLHRSRARSSASYIKTNIRRQEGLLPRPGRRLRSRQPWPASRRASALRSPLKQTYVTSNTNVGPQIERLQGRRLPGRRDSPPSRASPRSPWAPRPASASRRSSSPPASVATTTPWPPRWVRPRACSRASSPPATCRSLQDTNDPWIKLFTKINEEYNARRRLRRQRALRHAVGLPVRPGAPGGRQGPDP